MKKQKQRSHNEWFRTVSLGNRKSCPTCHEKLEPGESVWSWGEYVNAKWRTVTHFCKNCFNVEVKYNLIDHVHDCGCAVELCGQGCRLPDWLTLENPPERNDNENAVSTTDGHDSATDPNGQRES